MVFNSNKLSLCAMLRKLPDAVAVMEGRSIPVGGTVEFYQVLQGVYVVADISGLPDSGEQCGNSIFAFHIHDGSEYTGNDDEPFANAGQHYDPQGCSHPHHTGDMPPLFSAHGTAFLAFFTDRFSVAEVMGKTVVIHDRPDDFTTQPAGNAGTRIGCGVIMQVRR